jgi:hypothetical protein
LPKITLTEGDSTSKIKLKLVRRGFDLENIKIIPASEVPPPSRVRSPYRQLLLKIGKGQAVYLTPIQVSLATAAAAIRNLQKRGEFRDFKVTRRTIDGEERLYIINEGFDSSEPTLKKVMRDESR